MTSSNLKGSARAVVPARYDRSLVYVSGYDKKISLNVECLVISSFSGGRQEIPIKDVLSASIMGTAQISTQCIQSLMENGVKVMFCSSGGWLYGVAGGFTDKNLLV